MRDARMPIPKNTIIMALDKNSETGVEWLTSRMIHAKPIQTSIRMGIRINPLRSSEFNYSILKTVL